MDAVKLHPVLLIIDDDPLITELFQKYMTRYGFDVLTANCGAKGLARVQSEGEEPISLVLTDMSMPDMDGLEVARSLYALRPGLPVLIATGHDTEQLRLTVPTNVNTVIRKPYKNSVALELIRGILGLTPEP